MAREKLEFSILGENFALEVAPDQKTNFLYCVESLQKRLTALQGRFAGLNDARLLVMVALDLLGDKDTKKELNPAQILSEKDSKNLDLLDKRITDLSQRVDAILTAVS